MLYAALIPLLDCKSMGFIRWIRRLINPPVFVVFLHDGHATAEKGNLSVRFLTECSDLAKKRGIQDGRVYGVWKSDAVSLEFSPEIPEDHHQDIRDLWRLHRRRHKR